MSVISEFKKKINTCQETGPNDENQEKKQTIERDPR